MGRFDTLIGVCVLLTLGVCLFMSLTFCLFLMICELWESSFVEGFWLEC